MEPTTLASLPPEVILIIAENLDVTALNSFLRTCRRYHHLLDSRLYELALHYTKVPGVGSPLIWSVRNGVQSVMERLLRRGDCLSAVYNGTTALHEAVGTHNNNALRLLIDAGADIMVRNSSQLTPIVTAAFTNNEAALRLLLATGLGNGLQLATEVEEALLTAVGEQHESACKLLLEHPLMRNDATRREKANLAFQQRALFRGHCGIIRLLCDAGADPLSPGPDGRLPIQVAALNGYVDAVRLYLEYDADPAAWNRHSESPLHLAASCGHADVIQVLLDAGVDVDIATEQRLTPLMNAAMVGHRAAAERLVNAGANVHARCGQGFSVLEMAAYRNQAEMVGFLLEMGAEAYDPDARMSALHWAARNGNVAVINLLCDAGAPINALDHRCLTPLGHAVKRGQAAAVDALLQAGAEVAGGLGCGVLHLAAENGSMSVIKLLLQVGTDITDLNEGWDTPLHVAARHGRLEVFRVLLQTFKERGVDYLTRCDKGQTVLEKAAEYGQTEIVRLLLEEEDVNPNTHWKMQSALHSAVARRAADMAALLLSHGADPYSLNMYGHSAFDLAFTDPEIFTVFLDHGCKYRATEPCARLQCLRKTVVTLGRQLLLEKEFLYSSHHCNFCLIGPALRLLGDEEAARIMYGHHAERTRELFCYKWRCHMCRSYPCFTTRRYLCRTCCDVNVCAQCMDNVTRHRAEIKGCADHEYFEVPTDYQELPGERENGREIAWKQWLMSLVARYSVEIV